LLADIEKLIKRKLPQEIIDGFIPDPHAKAQPIQLRSFQGQNQGRGSAPRSNSGGNRSPQTNKPRSGAGSGGAKPIVKQSTPRRSGGRGGA